MEGKRMTPYCVSSRDVPDAKPVPKSVGKGAKLVSKLVYGPEMSLMVATREGGYHSAPHVHDAEQLCYVVSGRIWMFVEDDGFEASEGDFFRVPKGKIHWAWVRGSQPCSLFEVHSPPLTGDKELRENAVGLLAPEEDRSGIKGIQNVFVEYANLAEVEKRICGETGLL